MNSYAAGFWLLILAAAVPAGWGCSKIMGDSAISGRVTDSATGAPIESVEVYSCWVDRPPSWEEPEPVFQELTDADGRFFFWTSGKGIEIVEVRKVGYYETPPQIVKGGGEIDFVLVPEETQ